MKKLQISMIILMTTMSLYAQTDTLFLNDNWQETEKELATYSRVIEQINSEFKVHNFDKSGNLIFEGEYKTVNPEIENGHFSFYNQKGDKTVEGNFINGKMVNEWFYYGKKGKIIKTLDYSKLPIVDNDLVFSECEKYFSENPEVSDMPTFNNGPIPNFSKYLIDNFNLPEIPSRYNILGKVYVQFIVDKKGNMVNVMVQRSVHPHVDCEIKRIIATAPKWRPASHKGKKITLPITIAFEVNKSGSL